MWTNRHKLRWLSVLLLTLTGLSSTATLSAADTLSLNMRNVSIAEVMEMLSRKARTNIVLTSGVAGEVSVNLYDMELDNAIRAVADAAGYAVELRNGSYFIIARADAGKYANGGLTVVRSFELSYVDANVVSDVVTPLLSRYGEVTAVPDRRLIIVRDQPSFMTRIADMMTVLDRQPRQILIEAKILELTLDDTQSYGFDWSKFFSNDDGNGSFGTRGLASPGSPGSFFSLTEDKLTLALDALRSRGHVRTLSAPTLLALENQEASVVIGDRQGFRVTTTINQITTESIEFLESGVILRVTPTVDSTGRIMLDIHPEVSTGTITDGIPSQTTTEVTTRLLLPDSHSVFIGGLIKNSLSKSTSGVPVLGAIPVVRRLFSSDRSIALNTETIVVITPRLIEVGDNAWQRNSVEQLQRNEELLQRNLDENRSEMDRIFPTAQNPVVPLNPALPEPVQPVRVVDAAVVGHALQGLPAAGRASANDTVADYYTLKLFQARNDDVAQAFLQRYQSGLGDLQIMTDASSGLWIAYGQFADLDSATQAVDTLPEHVRLFDPVVVSVAALQDGGSTASVTLPGH